MRFETLGRRIAAAPRAIVFGLVALTLALSPGAVRVRVAEPPGDAPEHALFALTCKSGVWSLECLSAADELTRALASATATVARVDSLATRRQVVAEGGALHLRPLMAELPATRADLRRLHARALEDPAATRGLDRGRVDHLGSRRAAPRRTAEPGARARRGDARRLRATPGRVARGGLARLERARARARRAPRPGAARAGRALRARAGRVARAREPAHGPARRGAGGSGGDLVRGCVGPARLRPRHQLGRAVERDRGERRGGCARAGPPDPPRAAQRARRRRCRRARADLSRCPARRGRARRRDRLPRRRVRGRRRGFARSGSARAVGSRARPLSH